MREDGSRFLYQGTLSGRCLDLNSEVVARASPHMPDPYALTEELAACQGRLANAYELAQSEASLRLEEAVKTELGLAPSPPLLTEFLAHQPKDYLLRVEIEGPDREHLAYGFSLWLLEHFTEPGDSALLASARALALRKLREVTVSNW